MSSLTGLFALPSGRAAPPRGRRSRRVAGAAPKRWVPGGKGGWLIYWRASEILREWLGRSRCDEARQAWPLAVILVSLHMAKRISGERDGRTEHGGT
ncbi:MAG: hypothetical protein ACI89J_001923 [Hyphomicrobiaceae bacterium]|jgi:hypothetical protein